MFRSAVIASIVAGCLGGCSAADAPGGSSSLPKHQLGADDVAESAGPGSELEIVGEPQSRTVMPGDAASFDVEARCRGDVLQVQWQQRDGDDFIDIAQATRASFSFDASPDDSGAQFRAWVACGQFELVSQTVALTVPLPTGTQPP